MAWPHQGWIIQCSSAILAGLICVGCAAGRDDSITPQPTPTAWPTLAPLLSPADGSPAASLSGPQLIEKFRAEIVEGAAAIYPLEGHVDQPVRIEVIVLEGSLDPQISVNSPAGHRLALADHGGLGEPEVIGEFHFPAAGFYELGIGAVSGNGQVGVSIYRLQPALLEGSEFTSLDQELQGSITQPVTYHSFHLPLERGQRVDIVATARTEGLDLLFDLYGPDETLLASRDDVVGKDPCLWDFMPRQTGIYTIVLSNYGGSTGDYTLRASMAEPGDEAAIGIRTELELHAFPQRSRWLVVEGRALQALRIEARPLSPGVDIGIALYDQYGNRIVAADRGGPGMAELLAFVQLPFDGDYQLEFSALGEDGSIDYLIRPTGAADVELGGRVALSIFPHEGQILEPGTVIAYAFDADAGDLVGISARPAADTGLDLGFDVYGPNGYLLASHDDDVDKNPVADRIELPLTGRYVVALWNYADTTGPYEIVIANPEAPVAPPD